AYLIFKEAATPAKGFKSIHKEFVIENGAKGVSYQFDRDENSLLLIEVSFDGTRPDGTKRKVITYEDTDEIDDTKLNP
ncbi:MAG: hypothetical protein AAF617_02010, partial [Bacteroidota bacterium]